MRVKYVGGGMLPLVGTVVVKAQDYSIVRNEDKLKKLVDLGYEFVIKEDGEEIPAEEYFGYDEKAETVTETAEIKVVEEEVEEEVEEDIEEENDNQCQAITSSGTQCQNEAKYPKEDPQYCGIHKSKLE